MKKVLVFGSFDLLHEGHRYLFKEAKKLANKLFVVVARDSTIIKVKGKQPKFEEKERLKHVQDIKEVYRAVLGNLGDKYKIIEDIKPDIIALGYDQKFFADNLKEELKKRKLKIEVVRLKPFKPEKYKSSLLKL